MEFMSAHTSMYVLHSLQNIIQLSSNELAEPTKHVYIRSVLCIMRLWTFWSWTMSLTPDFAIRSHSYLINWPCLYLFYAYN